MKIGFLLLLAAGFFPSGIQGQQPPPYTPLGWDEDWSYLSDPSKALDWSDHIKHLNLFDGDFGYVSLGGQVRERGEYLDYPAFGEQPHDNGYLLQRYLFHADWHVKQWLRIFVEAGSSLETGRDGGPRPGIDQSQLYFNQAFVDLVPDSSFTIRAGRQLISLGSTRLFAIGAGLNVEQPFDGVRLTARAAPWNAGWNLDAFALRPVEVIDGYFRNKPNSSVETWGVYLSHRFRFLPKANVDVYAVSFDRKLWHWQQGTGREQRQSFGGRLWARTPTWYYDLEVTPQIGRLGSGHIRAWAFGYNAGYHFKDSRFTPQIELDGGITSGDQNLRDTTLGTFNALFPNGSYLSQSQLLGPYNIEMIRPKLQLSPTHQLTLLTNLEFLWRQSTTDGIYNIAGFLSYPSMSDARRFIGSQIQVEVDYAWSRHFSSGVAYEHFFPGSFLKETPLDHAVNFVGPQVAYTF